MKTWLLVTVLAVLTVLIGGLATSAPAQGLQLLSQIGPAQAPPAGGGGDSSTPVISPGGRYVLFASTANNLVLASNNLPIPARISPRLNVFLRDRAKATTTLVSVNLSGVAGGNGDSLPIAISANGKYVLFESSASDLVAGDTNNASDIFLRDLVNGTTILVSAATNGLPGNGASRSAAMTPNGRHVAFVSAANNLVAGDTNRIPDVFLRDVKDATTVLVSAGARAVPGAPQTSSEAPELTPDGRYVAFYSTATNLVPGVPPLRGASNALGGDVYVRDLASNTTVWASSYARTAMLTNDVGCFNHAISDDGRFVAYEAAVSPPIALTGTLFPLGTFGTVFRYSLDTGLTDIVATNAAVSKSPFEDIRSLEMTPDGRFIAFVANTNGTSGTTSCILLWDGASGTSTLVSSNLSGLVQAGSLCDWPAVDPSGRYVAFQSSATNMVTNAVSGEFHLYLRDTQSGDLVLLDPAANGVATGVSAATAPRLSADGRLVAFEWANPNLATSHRLSDSDVLLRDVVAGTTELISAHHPALATITPNGPSTLRSTSLSSDGRYVAFASEADNLVPNDTNGFRDIFVRDLATGTTTLVSVSTNGTGADGGSAEAAISPDGRYLAFTSLADNLAGRDTNGTLDVFLRDLQARTNVLVSRRTGYYAPALGYGASYAPFVSAGGRFVLFRSRDHYLAPGFFISENLFLRDMVQGTNFALTKDGVVSASTTPDGRWVAFVDAPGVAAGRYYLWDSLAGARVSTNVTPPGLTQVAISPDGNRLAYWAGSNTLQLYVADRAARTNWPISSGPAPTVRAALQFSGNSQVIAYNRALNNTDQVYCYDFQSGANLLLSTSFDSALPANGDSDSPAVSADGRFIAYRSAATNLVAGDLNDQPDIFVFDRQTGRNALLSASPNRSPNHRSLTPVFSGDGSTLLFETWASDVAPDDFNHSSDLFAYTFLTAVLFPSGTPGEGPWVSWPWVPGRNYRVQYKDSLGALDWNDLPGSITNAGTKAWSQDPAPAGGQRFYRVLSF